MIVLGDTGYLLYFWYEARGLAREQVTRDQALLLLHRSDYDIWTQAALRTVIEKEPAPTPLARLNEEQIREEIAQLIESGNLVLVRRAEPVLQQALGTAPKSAPAPLPAPRPVTQSTAPPPAPDPPIFPANVDPVAQAAANQAAAQQGAPFCEH